MRRKISFLLASMLSFGAFAQTYTMQAGTQTVTTCGGTFYDNGGASGSYSSDFNGTTTFYPTTLGAKVRMTFTTFNTESCCDKIFIYNGNSINAPVLVNNFGGSALPNGGAVIESTAADGSLTVRFSSDGSITYAGWAATLGCTAVTLPACSGPITGINTAISSTFGSLGSTVSIVASGFSTDGNGMQWQSAPALNGPWTDIAGQTTFNASVLAPNYATTTYYRLKLTCLNTNDESYTTPVSYETRAIFNMSNGVNSYTTCEGIFYDSGGANGQYQTSEEGVVTFYPATPGASVVLQFTQFALEGCCDYFYVYNGNSTNAPAIVNGIYGTALPLGGAPIMSTAADGSLTVRFTSDGSVVNDGWVASISCVSPCDGPISITNATISLTSGIPSTSVTVNAGAPTAANIAYQWEIASDINGPWGNVAGATSFLNTFNAPAAPGLYYYRLKTTCNTTNDVTYSNILNFQVYPTHILQPGTNSVTMCDGLFVDNGGNGNYSSNFNGTVTFYPTTPGGAVTLQFTSFQVATTGDFLNVYNGNSIAAPVLVSQANGLNLPNGGQVISSTAPDGSLTVRFISDGSGVNTGWVASIGCTTNPNPVCDNTITAGTTVLSVSSIATNLAFNASVNGASLAQGVAYQWQVATDVNGPWTNIAGATNMYANLTSSTDAGTYFYRLQMICAATSTETYSTAAQLVVVPVYIMNTSGTQSITSCGLTFYDSGNSTGNYSNNESGVVTFYPSTPGAAVALTFTQFQLEGCCDYLYVYNGNSITAPVLVNGVNGTNTPNGGNTIMSTAADGSLTVRFTSDGSVQQTGWQASLTCMTPCTGPVDDLTASLSHASGTASSTFSATVGAPNYANVSYQWQTSESENGPWTNVTGATNFTSTITAPATEGVSYYRLQTTCVTTSDVAYTNAVSFTVLPSIIMEAGPSIISTCEGIFVDNGGNGSYTNNFNGTTTFVPTSPSLAVTLQFTSFYTENYSDDFYIYDGGSTLSPVIISEFGGQALPLGGQVITSTSLDGALTVRFVTDASVTYAGWQAIIGCTTNMHPLCDASVTSGTAVLTHTSGGVNTTIFASVTGNSQSAGISYQWQKAPTNAGPWEDIAGAVGLNGIFPAEATIGNYYYRLVSTCENTQTTAYSTPAMFTTYGQYVMNTTGNQTVTSCGISFVDSGGENGEYSNNEDGVVTFYPTSPTTQVQLTFTYFNMESPTWDNINIYNGNSTAAPLLITNHGGTTLPNNGQPIVSTAADGSLTFKFTSDTSGEYGGWIANLTCLCENITETVDVAICSNQTPYYFYGEYLDESGTYTHNIPLEFGCDSVITLNLLINPLLTDTNSVTACSSYFWPRTSSTYTESGIFTVSVPNLNACDSVFVLDLTVSISDLTLTATGSTLTANQNDATYQWLNCGQNYAVIPGATEQSFTPTASGLYACRVTYDGCTANTNCMTVNVVGVDGVASSNFTVYPNPSKGRFTVATSTAMNDAKIEVYSVVGQIVYTGVLTGNEMMIDLEEQPNGVYIIKVNNQENLRLIKSN